MAGKCWRTLWFGLHLIVSTALLSAQETRQTSVLGRHPRIEFQGCESFTPKQILHALNRDPDYQAVLLSHTTLDVFRDQLTSSVRDGYLTAGFARAAITVNFREAASDDPFAAADISVIVEIREGKPYPAGKIELLENRSIDAEQLLRDIQEIGNRAARKATAGQASGGDAAHRLPSNGPANPNEPAPIWKSGTLISSSPETEAKFTHLVKMLLADQGFLWSRVVAKIEPDDATMTSVLKIKLEAEGPRATVGKVDVTGHSRNSTESILELLNLPIGTPLNARLLEVANQRLYESGRFLKFELKLDLVHPPVDGAAPISLEVRESDLVPLLTQQLSEEQEVLLKYGRWQEKWGSQTTPYRFSITDFPIEGVLQIWSANAKGTVADLEITLLPATGIYWSWVLKPAGHPEEGRSFHLLMDVHQIDCVFPAQRRRLTVANPFSRPGSTGRLVVRHAMRPLTDEERRRDDAHPTTSLFGSMSTDLERRPDASAIQFSAEIAPVAMLELATVPGTKSQFTESELVLDVGGNIFRIDRQTGELNSLNAALIGKLKKPLEIRKDPDALTRIHDFMNSESQGFETWTGDEASLACAITLLWNQIDTRQPRGVSEATLSTMRSCELLLRESFAHHAKKSELTGAKSTHAEFRIPTKHGVFHFDQFSKSDAFFGLGLTGLYDNVFAHESGFWDMSRFVAVALSRNVVSKQFLLDTTANAELGPLAHLYGTILLRPFDRTVCDDIAVFGQRKLNALEFGREIKSLVMEDSFWSDALLIAARRMAKCSDKELAQLAAQLAITEHHELLSDIRRQLSAAANEQQLRDATVAAAIQLWSPIIKSRLTSTFEQIRPPRLPPGPGSSNLKIEIEKHKQSTN